MRRQFAVMLLLITGVILLFAIIFLLTNKTDADVQCYRDFKPTLTWNYRVEELNAMASDNKLTVGECMRMHEIYEEAQKAQLLR